MTFRFRRAGLGGKRLNVVGEKAFHNSGKLISKHGIGVMPGGNGIVVVDHFFSSL